MKNSAPYRQLLTIAFTTIAVLAMVWSLSGFAVWNTVRLAHRQYVLSGPGNKYRDTVALASVQDIHWMHDEEARLDGYMFDVKKKVYTPEGIVLIGHYDEKDDHLFSWLHRLVNGHHPAGKSKSSFWFFDAIVTPLEIQYTHTTEWQTRPVDHHLQEHWSSRASAPVAPPPRC